MSYKLSKIKLGLRGVDFTLLLLRFVVRQGVMVISLLCTAPVEFFCFAYNCRRYEACVVTCTFLVDRLCVYGCGWQLYVLYIPIVYVGVAGSSTYCSYSLILRSLHSLVPRLPCSTRTLIYM